MLASWAELETNPSPHVQPEGPAPADPVRRAAQELARDRLRSRAAPRAAPEAPVATSPEPDLSTDTEPGRLARRGVVAERRRYTEAPGDRSLRVLAVGSVRKLFAHPGALWGGGVRVGEERFRFVGWSADVLRETGPIRTSGGSREISATTIGGALFVCARLGPVTGRVGAGVRAGITDSTPGTSSLAPWGWPLGAESLSVRVGFFVIEVSGEAGYTVMPVSTNGGERDIRSGWFSGQIGLGLMPGWSQPRVLPAPAAAAGE